MTTRTAEHILIVDDDREIRELLGAYLEKNGLRVATAPTGRHMRAALDASGPFDLIVLDLMLPGEDGLALCRDLRSGRHKATPIVMLTARSGRPTASSASRWAPTTTLPSPSRRASCWRACVP